MPRDGKDKTPSAKTAILRKSNEFTDHLFRKLCNEQAFPKRSRWLFSGKIADLANDYMTCINVANEIRVVTPKEREARHYYQTMALARLQALDAKINQLHQAALLDDIDKALEEFCKHSSRYMDDFLILDKRKVICKRAEKTVADMLEVKGLRCVNKNGIFRLKDGFYYLGLHFRLTDTGKVIVRLHPDAMRYERNALRGLKRALDAGKTDMAHIRVHYQCFIARAEYSRGDGAIHSMDKFYTELFREKPIYKRKRRYFYGCYSVRQRENPASRTGESGAPDRAEQDERDAGIRRHDGRR